MWVPLVAHVFPCGVGRLNQCNLLRAGPSFEFLLTLDCIADLRELLIPDESGAVIAGSEPAVCLLLVLEHSPEKVACYAYVESSAPLRMTRVLGLGGWGPTQARFAQDDKALGLGSDQALRHRHFHSGP